MALGLAYLLTIRKYKMESKLKKYKDIKYKDYVPEFFRCFVCMAVNKHPHPHSLIKLQIHIGRPLI